MKKKTTSKKTTKKTTAPVNTKRFVDMFPYIEAITKFVGERRPR